MKQCLIVFAREPRAAQVKTRLKSALSGNDRMYLYKAFLEDSLCLAKETRSQIRFVAYDSPHRSCTFLKQKAAGFGLFPQQGADLGQRMLHAFQTARRSKADKTVIMGSDSPNLPASIVAKAFSRLGRHDLVLGPSLDGGFYLIGMKKPHKDLFKGVRWSSPSVLRKTIDNASKLSLDFSLLDRWYDIDDRESLAFLIQDLKKQHPKKAAHTRRALVCLGLSK